MDTVKLDEYLRSPCMASSLPYWKAQKTVIPDNMMIIRDDAFFKDKYTEYKDSPYFKLIHRLKHIEKPVLSKRFSLCTKGIDAFAQHIQECYGGGISADELREWPPAKPISISSWINYPAWMRSPAGR